MTLPPEVQPLVRTFANNGFRYLFKQADNVADLLHWRKPEIASGIDFGQMSVQPDTFVTAGFRELESDVLLRAPWQSATSQSAAIQVYVLIEHLSEPDEHAVFRVGRYTMQIYDKQEKQWLSEHSNTRGLIFEPVLPVVFYSGTRTWDKLTPMRQLVHEGELFGSLIPSFEPVFVNLTTTAASELQTQVGTFGWVLWLIQQKRRKQAIFKNVLQQAITRVDQLHTSQRGRWEHLLWFSHALVYNARKPAEREPLAGFIRSTVRQADQPEVRTMAKTIADALREEGEAAGIIKGVLANQRETLLRQLRLKFKRVSPSVTAEIEAEQDSRQLADWLDALISASKLSDMPFQAYKKS